MEERHSRDREVMVYSYLCGVAIGLAISLAMVAAVATTDVYMRSQKYRAMQQSLDEKAMQEKLEAEGYE